MRDRHFWLAAATLPTACLAASASACLISVPTELSDVKYADIVVVGRIANYKIVLDQKWREADRKQFFASGKWLNPFEYFKQNDGYITDYARFDILVDQVLVGKATKKLTVTWDASTFAEPDKMPPGPYLIALRQPGSKTPPLRGPSATVFPSPEPHTPTVLHPPCAGAFIFDSNGAEAADIRLILQGRAMPPPPVPSVNRANWTLPSAAAAERLYPPRARNDEEEGSATVECIVARAGAVEKCRIATEFPAGYGFGEATVKLYQGEARVKAGTYKPGDKVRLTWRWMLP